MKKNREELEKALYVSIDENIVNRRKIINNITEQLTKKHNISPGKVKMVYNKSIPIQTLSNAELYVFAKALYDITEDEKINPSSWFNEEEIKTYDLYKASQFYKGDVVVFSNVDQVSDVQWFCSKAMYQEMSDVFAQGLITYNIRTQRETTTVMFNNIATEIPTIKQKPIIEMTQLMLNGKFTPNTIALNIRKTGNEVFEYNSKDRTLSIAVDGENTFLDIIDGMHRMQAAMRAVEANPEINLYTSINILNYTEEEAQQFINQEDHRTPISRAHITAFKNDDDGVMMAKYVNKYGNERTNEMFNKLAMNENELKLYNKYTTIEAFAKAFNYNFKIERAREFSKIQKFMVDYFNELIGILQEKGIPKEKSLYGNIFVGYIALAASIYKEENWKDMLESVLNKIDFESDEVKSFLTIGRVGVPLIKKISEYFKNWR